MFFRLNKIVKMTSSRFFGGRVRGEGKYSLREGKKHLRRYAPVQEMSLAWLTLPGIEKALTGELF